MKDEKWYYDQLIPFGDKQEEWKKIGCHFCCYRNKNSKRHCQKYRVKRKPDHNDLKAAPCPYYKRQLTLGEKWTIDTELAREYPDNTPLALHIPQCDFCGYQDKSDVMHCDQYKEQEKPKAVVFSKELCGKFRQDKDEALGVTYKDWYKAHRKQKGICSTVSEKNSH